MTHSAPTAGRIAIADHTAAPSARAVIEAIFAKRMASALIDGEPIDLADDAACAHRLEGRSFGDRLISALLPQAQATAVKRAAA